MWDPILYTLLSVLSNIVVNKNLPIDKHNLPIIIGFKLDEALTNTSSIYQFSIKNKVI